MWKGVMPANKTRIAQRNQQQTNAKLNTREALDTYIGKLHYEVALSSGIQLDLSSSQQIDKNGTFHTYYRENISRRTG